ncbi:hypothetical protein [Dactylosporangium sp. CA-092794]|uniref:hypothetical protein n=1 Tax=Dactylosporangium sp. CA-092794 TaxID=3239929 RepID=UPI003D926E1A
MKWVVGAAFAVVAYAVALIGWLLVPGCGPVPFPLCLVALLAPFPLAAAGAIVGPRVPLRRPGAVVAGAGAALVALLFAALVATVALPLPAPPGPGVPEDVGGGYVLDQHGSQTPLSVDDYRTALMSHERFMLWTGALLCLVGTLAAGVHGERLADRAARRG